MFDVLRKSFGTGVVTTRYPQAPPEVSARARGKPEIDWANWKDARPAAKICPTGAIAYEESNGYRTARLDLGQCIFCGLCADADKAIRMTNVCECASGRRDALVAAATYSLNPDGTHQSQVAPPLADHPSRITHYEPPAALEALGAQAKERITRLL